MCSARTSGKRGVPLCGHLLDRDPEDLSFAAAEHLAAPHVAELLDSIVGVVVPVFETDSQIVLRRESSILDGA